MFKIFKLQMQFTDMNTLISLSAMILVALEALGHWCTNFLFKLKINMRPTDYNAALLRITLL